ncbi:MAG: hypothetical protein QM704_16065 [Anaeromyxobacteraceae bacterium]
MTELDPLIAEARLEHNLRRALPTLAVAAAVVFCHVLYFATPGGDPGSVQARWEGLLEVAHEGLFVALVALTLLVWHAGRARPAPWRAVVPPAIALVATAGGAVLAGIDQLVTAAITPYLIASFGVPLLVRLPIWQAAAIQLAGMALLAQGILAHQVAAAGRISALVNGLSVSALGVALGATLTRAFERAEGARLVIARQGKELAELRGLLRICAYCGRIHEEGKWERLDHYVARHTAAELSHGMCEDCFAKELAKLKP